MTMNRHHNTRTGSCNRKLLSPLTKSSRPSSTRRITGQQTTSTSPSINGTAIATRTSSRSSTIVDETSEDIEEPDEMASFLQFCATCEKQIVIPTIMILYCSEACRRRDSAKSIPTSVTYSPPLSPSMVYYDYPPTTIVPRRSPTVLRPLSTTFSQLSLYELDADRKTSLDILDESTFGMPTESRAYVQRSSTSEESTATPSLVHSPASSYGTTTSIAERPLPRKHSCTTNRGIELVTPMPSSSVKLSTNTAVAEPRRRSEPVEQQRQRQRKKRS